MVATLFVILIRTAAAAAAAVPNPLSTPTVRAPLRLITHHTKVAHLSEKVTGAIPLCPVAQLAKENVRVPVVGVVIVDDVVLRREGGQGKRETSGLVGAGRNGGVVVVSIQELS